MQEEEPGGDGWDLAHSRGDGRGSVGSGLGIVCVCARACAGPSVHPLGKGMQRGSQEEA